MRSIVVTGWAIALAVASAGCKGKADKAAPNAKPTGKVEPTQPPPSTGSAGADTPPPASADAIVPVLYEIERDGKTSHLLATVDLGVDVEAQLPAWVWTKFDLAKTLIIQWNLEEVTAPMLRRTDGKQLAADLTPEELAALEAALGKDDVAALADIKPSFVAAIVSGYGLSARNPMQAVLAARADAKTKPTRYLETAADQQALMDRHLDVAAIKALIADLDGVRAGNQAVLAAYAKGDVAALTARVDDRTPWKTAGRKDAALVEMRADTLERRTKAWVGTLAPALATGDAFIAADVFNVIGDAGLVAQLTAAGYKVTPIAGP